MNTPDWYRGDAFESWIEDPPAPVDSTKKGINMGCKCNKLLEVMTRQKYKLQGTMGITLNPLGDATAARLESANPQMKKILRRALILISKSARE